MKRINLGCGENRLPGWENHDRDVDITKPLPWMDATVDFILAEHVVEHVTGPQGFWFMRECLRILKPGGILRVCVPMLRNVDQAKRVDLIVNHGHLMVYCPETLRQMLTTAGFSMVNASERDDCDGHYKVIGRELDDAETLRMVAIK